MPGVRLIDPAEEAAKQTAAIVQQHNPQKESKDPSRKRQIECYVTDLAPTFVRLAGQFLGMSSEYVHQVSIEENWPKQL